jgi:signal transduction histidine kinase/CheY-like chemotaxis protein/HPt (histidine-containing phosphotransfer) domain-containing protein
MADHNPVYSQSRFVPEYIAKTGVDAVLFFRNDGTLDTWRQLARNQPEFTDHGWPELLGLSPQSPLLQLSDARPDASGIVMTHDGAVLLASQRILHSDLTGPSRGVLVFARRFENGIQQRMADAGGLTFVIGPSGGETGRLLSSLVRYNAQIYVDSPTVLTVDIGLDDLYTEPDLALHSQMRRDILIASRQTLALATLIVLCGGLLVMLVVILFMDRMVLGRLSRLQVVLQDVTASGDLSRRTVVDGRDELGSLAGEFNEMLSEMEIKEAALDEAVHAANAAAHAKSEFLATMSHEIRTPMNGIIGMSSLLSDTELNGEQREFTQIIEQSAQQLLRIVNDILDFSKAEAGRMEIEVIDFDLRQLVESTAELFAPRAHERGLELVALIDPALPVLLRGDPGRIRQILNNYLSNALKFTEQGEIVLSVRPVGDAAADGSRSLRFEVRDTGIGIPPDRLGRLFRSFSQVDASTTRKYGGTGLGLAICKQLSELMGGSAGVDSVDGQGSTFWCELRVYPQTGEARPEPATPEELRGLRAIVVDDNAATRQVLDYTLRRWEIDPVLEADPRRALPAMLEADISGTPFAFAILDNRMPHIEGDELARLIKGQPRLAEVPLVMLTSTAERGDAQRVEEAGFAAFLVKPVRQETLQQCILTVLGGARSAAGEKPLVTQHSLTEMSLLRLRALLVDDNPVNLTVGQRMLEKAGVTVSTAVNGAEAVQAVAIGEFDVVLMDMHMPVMDGLEATEGIRALPEPKCHVPVVAMTASVSDADRQRCQAVGMNGFVSKPVQQSELLAAIASACGSSGKPLPAVEAAAAPEQPAVAVLPAAAAPGDEAGQPPLDLAGSIERAGDPDFWQVLVGAFFDETTKRLAELSAAAQAGDVPTFTRSAHTIKGSSAELLAEPMRALAYELELLGKSGSLDGYAPLLEALEREFARLRQFLDAHHGQMLAA